MPRWALAAPGSDAATAAETAYAGFHAGSTNGC